ncbi:AraC family ligand binding domain-containing protein [Streptococcus massiliensis]|uniref:AraC-like ligand binding domain n=1 Tax=Streptococcus massiliensis TaxID=313439 RepID=A0A380KVG4_9STRE|nr:AraC family ligand binding domain-containing protein [Streptococcus massiliensis]SUN75902.1 AraC-like ligand binding domain [Streptococcus massiliensis]
MKFYTIDKQADFAETPVQETGRIIHHLHLAAGKEVPEHSADALVTVICLQGKVDFNCQGETVQLVPGSFLTMEPNELHSLVGLEDSHLYVIKQLLY